MRRSLILGWMAGAAMAFPAQAQYSGAVLQPGQVYEGRLTASSSSMGDGTVADCFVIHTQSGANYAVTIQSSEFEPYMMAGEGNCDGNATEFASNRVAFSGTGGTYSVYVQNNRPRDLGSFSLRVQGPASRAAVASGPAGPAAAAARLAASYDAAWDAYEARRYAEAARLMLPFANNGDAAAQNAMGYLTFYGHGVAKDVIEAARWYTKAAEQGHEPSQRTLVQIGPNVTQAMFLDHIDRYGPDTTDLASFSYDVAAYCALNGRNCQALMVQRRQRENAHNRAAEAANMRRIWNNYGNGQSQEQFFSNLRARSECLRRVTQSINDQTYGRQSWRYVDSC